MQAATISPFFVKASLQGAIRKGYNPEEILLAQGLPPQILQNPKLRISTLAFAELSKALTELMRDEAVGLLQKPSPIGQLRLLTQACLACRNLKESMTTWRDGTNWLDSSVSAYSNFTDNGGFIALNCDIAEDIEVTYITDTLLTTFHRIHCWLANEFLPIERVDLSYEKPAHSEEHRFVYYGAPVHYGQRRNALHFSKQILERPCQRTADELRQLYRNPHAYILTLPRQSKSAYIKTRLWMEKLFREGNGLPQLNEAADYMGLTEQTLRRRLKADGYSFNKLKEDTRRDMAIYYIKQSQQSVEEIAFRLGFSEASTFIRAFKKWTGLTPLAYRKL
ncbi:AraC family transcriptional regulator [Maricurvus nonylphenolicus]|uniref:AraC family transcriptional regulator n=1 Tax=Maricurvus nonylphenolicus TaxID=1008307 RepID=UPI0036F1B287